MGTEKGRVNFPDRSQQEDDVTVVIFAASVNGDRSPSTEVFTGSSFQNAASKMLNVDGKGV